MTNAGAHQRFEQLMFPHLHAAYNLARWLVRNDEDARDIVQEAYLRAYKYFTGFHGDNARVWLLAIARRTCYSGFERNRKDVFMVDIDAPLHTESVSEHVSYDTPETLFLQHESAQMLNQALDSLALEFRAVLVLRALEDLSYREIATVLDIPIGTVMSRLARGRKLLELALQRMRAEA